jgi:hypothetical protein
MPASRRVNAAYVQAVHHADAVWRTVVSHVYACEKKCTFGMLPDGNLILVPTKGCDAGEMLADEWRIAAKRCDEAIETACGGTAQPTKGVNHE